MRYSKNYMKGRLITFLLLLTAYTLAAQQPVYTNVIGMESVLIKPGSMTVGKFQPAVSPVGFDGKPHPEKMY